MLVPKLTSEKFDHLMFFLLIGNEDSHNDTLQKALKRDILSKMEETTFYLQNWYLDIKVMQKSMFLPSNILNKSVHTLKDVGKKLLARWSQFQGKQLAQLVNTSSL